MHFHGPPTNMQVVAGFTILFKKNRPGPSCILDKETSLQQDITPTLPFLKRRSGKISSAVAGIFTGNFSHYNETIAAVGVFTNCKMGDVFSFLDSFSGK